MAETSARKLADIVDANGNVDVNAGAIDGTDITVGSGKTLNVSAGTLTLANDQISGDAINGGTISNFRSTGIDDSASTTTALTIDASGNVGIGTPAPASNIEIKETLSSSTENKDLLSLSAEYGSATGDGFGSSISWNGRTNGNIYQEVAKIGSHNIVGDNGANLVFYTRQSAGSYSERMRITSTGHVELKTTNAKLILPSGGGIDFGTGTTGTGTVTSGVLDDYEEGTWTPVFDTSNGDLANFSMHNNQSSYVKVGRLVFIRCSCATINAASISGTGYLILKGLPFTQRQINFANFGYSIFLDGVFSSRWTNQPIMGNIQDNSTNMILSKTRGGYTDMTVADFYAINTGNFNTLSFNAVYETS